MPRRIKRQSRAVHAGLRDNVAINSGINGEPMSTLNKNPATIQTADYSKHAKLKVKPNPGFAHAKNRNLVAVSVAELGICSGNFPLVFVKAPEDKRYVLMAMLGLKAGENMYFGEQFWESTYVPLAVQRHPFIVGIDERVQDNEQLATCLEMDSPFLNEKEGVALFNEDGEESETLRNAHQLLSSMFEGGKFTGQFIQKLVELNLVVTLDLSLQLRNGEMHKVSGLFTVDENALKDLSAEQLKELQVLGFLAPCYLMLVSLYQLNQLIRQRNRKGLEQITGFRIELNGQVRATE